MHEVVVGALVSGGRVLLGHRSPHRAAYPDVWDLPGGHVEAGETELQALSRELAEELGVRIAPGAAAYLGRLSAGTGAGSVRLSVWLVDAWSGTPRNLAPDEHDEITWFGVDELPPLAHHRLGPLVREAVRGWSPMDTAAPEPATPAEVRAALAGATAWAPDLHPDARYAVLADLDVDAVVAAQTRRLGGVPRRVAQSSLVMGLAARLWAVTVVPAAEYAVLPDPAALRVRHDDGALTLGVVAGAGGWRRPSPDDVRAAVLGVLEPLIAALPLSHRLLWGDVAAGLYAVPRVHAAPATTPLVADLLARPPLAGELDARADGTARRRTCCLFYLVPGAGLCADCVLDHIPRRT